MQLKYLVAEELFAWDELKTLFGVLECDRIGWTLLEAELESGDGNDCIWLGVSDSELLPEERIGVEVSAVESLMVSSSSSSLESIVMISTFGRFGSDLSGAFINSLKNAMYRE